MVPQFLALGGGSTHARNYVVHLLTRDETKLQLEPSALTQGLPLPLTLTLTLTPPYLQLPTQLVLAFLCYSSGMSRRGMSRRGGPASTKLRTY
jgi:hypothetical protein